MSEIIRDVMTTAPRCLDTGATVTEAAEAMLQDDIGDVIVCSDDQVHGIITDRDIVLRVVAPGKDPSGTHVGDVCSRNPECLSPDDTTDDAVRLIREHAVRRIPVVEAGRPVGIVSIGDLAIDLDRESALADVSAAPGNT